MITGKRILAAIMILLFLCTGSLGCASSDSGKIDPEKALRNDAVNSLKGEIGEDYTQLTIIRGSLYKLTIDPSKLEFLGIAIGALQASVFPQKYEYERFTQLTDISPEMKKDIIAQPFLNIVRKKKDVLTHLYNDVLDPLTQQLNSGKPVTPDQVAALNQVVRILDRMASEYATLIKPEVDLNSTEAEDCFFLLQDCQKDLQKIKLPAYKVEQ